jgi:hypothetical protein
MLCTDVMKVVNLDSPEELVAENSSVTDYVAYLLTRQRWQYACVHLCDNRFSTCLQKITLLSEMTSDVTEDGIKFHLSHYKLISPTSPQFSLQTAVL